MEEELLILIPSLPSLEGTKQGNLVCMLLVFSQQVHAKPPLPSKDITDPYQGSQHFSLSLYLALHSSITFKKRDTDVFIFTNMHLLQFE